MRAPSASATHCLRCKVNEKAGKIVLLMPDILHLFKVRIQKTRDTDTPHPLFNIAYKGLLGGARFGDIDFSLFSCDMEGAEGVVYMSSSQAVQD